MFIRSNQSNFKQTTSHTIKNVNQSPETNLVALKVFDDGLPSHRDWNLEEGEEHQPVVLNLH